MAIFNEILSGRFNRALQKLTGIKGGPPVRQLGSEILPIIPLFFGVENRYLESWQRFGQGFIIPANAGFNSAIRFRNPTVNNVVAVIEMIQFSVDNAVSVDLRIEGPTPTTTDLGSIGTANVTRFDARGQQSPSIVVSSQNTAAIGSNGNTSWQAFLGPSAAILFNAINDDNQEIPLLPGDAIQIRDATVNTNLACTVWWRERFLEDSERT